MTAPVAAGRVDSEDLVAACADHVTRLAIGDGSRDARRRAAHRFSEPHPDLGVWLARPTPSRVADLHRDKAWPFVVWAAVAGHLRVDVEQLLTKPGGVDLSVVWDRLHPAEIERAEAVGRELGWSANWVRQVARHSLPVVCTRAAKRLDGLDDDDLAGFRAEVERAAHLSESARTKARTRLFAVGQICFQLGLATRPPRRGVAQPARTPARGPGVHRRGMPVARSSTSPVRANGSASWLTAAITAVSTSGASARGMGWGGGAGR